MWKGCHFSMNLRSAWVLKFKSTTYLLTLQNNPLMPKFSTENFLIKNLIVTSFHVTWRRKTPVRKRIIFRTLKPMVKCRYCYYWENVLKNIKFLNVVYFVHAVKNQDIYFFQIWSRYLNLRRTYFKKGYNENTKLTAW